MPQSTGKGADPPAREIASARKNISDQDRQLASNAFTEFKAKRYDVSLQVLKKLSEVYIFFYCIGKHLNVAKSYLMFGLEMLFTNTHRNYTI